MGGIRGEREYRHDMAYPSIGGIGMEKAISMWRGMLLEKSVREKRPIPTDRWRYTTKSSMAKVMRTVGWSEEDMIGFLQWVGKQWWFGGVWHFKGLVDHIDEYLAARRMEREAMSDEDWELVKLIKDGKGNLVGPRKREELRQRGLV